MAVGGREEEKQENGTSYLLSISLTAEGSGSGGGSEGVWRAGPKWPPASPHLPEPHPDPFPFSGPGEVEEVEWGRGGRGGTGKGGEEGSVWCPDCGWD